MGRSWLHDLKEHLKSKVLSTSDSEYCALIHRIEGTFKDHLAQATQTEVSFISIEEFSGLQHAFSCQLGEIRPGESGSTSQHGSFSGLNRKDLLLVGTLRACDVATYPGGVVLKDRTGEIILEFSKFSIQKFSINKLVLLLNWNFIPSKTIGSFIEVLSPPIVVEDVASSDKCVNAIPVEEAIYILISKTKCGVESINVNGTVSSVTSVIRIRDTSVFALQLSSHEGPTKINILVTQEEFLHWQKIISPDDVYTITDLVPTTYNEGKSTECKLFVLSETSQLLNTRYHAVNILSLSQCVEVGDVKISRQVSSPPHCLDNCESVGDFKTIQGIITSNCNAHQGIYELNHKLTLNLGYIICKSAFRSLRIGTEVIVYNAHVRTLSVGGIERSTPGVHCCMMGCVKVLNFSTFDAPCKPFLYNQCPAVKTASIYNLAVNSFCQLLTTDKTLQVKLSPRIISESSCKELYSKIFTNHFPASSRCGRKKTPRPILSEVWSTPHCCPMTITPEILPDFPSMNDFTKQIREIIFNKRKAGDNVTNLDVLSVVRIPASELKSHIIVACLQSSKKTGCVEMVDQTGAITCVVTDSSNNDPIHTCDNSCDTHAPTSCPYFHPDHNKSIVMLKDYVIVAEWVQGEAKLTTGSTSCLAEHNSTPAPHKVYLMFSMCNITILSQGKRTNLIENQTNPGVHKRNDKTFLKRRGSPLSSDCSEFMKSNDVGEQPSGKKSKLNIPQVDLSMSNLQFSSFRQKVLVTHKESLFTKGTYKQDSQLFFFMTCYFLGNTDILLQDGSQCKVESVRSESQHMLCFSDDVIKWYPMMHSGCVYEISSREMSDLELFQSKKQTDFQWQKAVDFKPLVSITSSMQILKVASENDAGEATCDQATMSSDAVSPKSLIIRSINELTVSQNVSETVSFIGRIVSKTLVPSTQRSLPRATLKPVNIDAFIPENKELLITLQDLTTPDRVKVFLNLQSYCYPLGLIEGAIVECHRFDWRVSHLGNNYSHFLPSSSVVVRKLTSSVVNLNRYQPVVTEATTLPHCSLGDIWEPGCCKVFQCYCFINEIHSLTFKSTCTLCESCDPTRPCEHDRLFQAEACIRVEDGSGSAKAYARNDVVRQLLDVSEDVWNTLEKHVSRKGELTYRQQDKTFQCRVLRKLRRLCRSSTVLRPVLMSCSQSKGNKTEKDVDDWTIDDYGTDRELVDDVWSSVITRPTHILTCHSVCKPSTLQLLQSQYSLK